MNRSLSKRETVLLVIMILLIIGIGYYKFILEPINNSVDNYMMMTQDEQDQIMQNTALIQKKKSMEAELEELFAQGTPTAIPSFDNSGILMVELHSILDDSLDYTLSFGDTASLKCGYLLRRRIITMPAASSTGFMAATTSARSPIWKLRCWTGMTMEKGL